MSIVRATVDVVNERTNMANEVKKLVEEPSKGFVAYPPDNDRAPVAIHRTESDRRAIANPIARLRQRGAPL
jgi:hypothetical protein